MSTAGATDGNVTLLIDLMAGGYASFDNVLITAAQQEGVPTIPEPASLLLVGAGLASAAKFRKRANS